MEHGKTKKRLFSEEDNLNLIVEDSVDQDEANDGDDVNQNQPKNKKIWNQEEDIAILNGIIKFSVEKGVNPAAAANKNELFAFLKEEMEVSDFTKEQLRSKLRSFGRKFTKITSSGSGGNNKGKIISTPHEDKVCELLKKLWGGGGEVAEEHHEEEPNEMTKNVDEIFDELGENNNVVEQALARLGEAKKEEFKKELVELEIMELEFIVKKAKLVQFQTENILDAYKKSLTK